jgi:hypothetical protein
MPNILNFILGISTWTLQKLKILFRLFYCLLPIATAHSTPTHFSFRDHLPAIASTLAYFSNRIYNTNPSDLLMIEKFVEILKIVA